MNFFNIFTFSCANLALWSAYHTSKAQNLPHLDKNTESKAKEIALAMGITQAIDYRQNDEPGRAVNWNPFGTPIVILPPSDHTYHNEFTIAHELAHIKHRDHLKSQLGIVAISAITAISSDFCKKRSYETVIDSVIFIGLHSLGIYSVRRDERNADLAAAAHVDAKALAKGIRAFAKQETAFSMDFLHPPIKERINYLTQIYHEKPPSSVEIIHKDSTVTLKTDEELIHLRKVVANSNKRDILIGFEKIILNPEIKEDNVIIDSNEYTANPEKVNAYIQGKNFTVLSEILQQAVQNPPFISCSVSFNNKKPTEAEFQEIVSEIIKKARLTQPKYDWDHPKIIKRDDGFTLKIFEKNLTTSS